MAKHGSDSDCFITTSQSEEDNRCEDHVDPSYTEKVLRPRIPYIRSTSLEHDQVKILVLYTGGTIGMRRTDGVYVPESNYLAPQLRGWRLFHDCDYKMPSDIHPYSSPLVMPLSQTGKRVFYSLVEYEPLLDSANMTVQDYARLAKDIKDAYCHFDGFVILHGTDTMAYTASALSFMLENLGKPVVLTGSQIPIFEIRSDGRDNFLGALIMTSHYCIPEVAIYFHNMLLRGNRSTKYDTGAFNAFRSINMAPLAELEVDIKVNWEIIWQPRGIHKFHVHTDLNANVGLLRLFPSITAKTVESYMQEPMEGVVIQSYGAGNGPDARKDLLCLLKAATDRGLVIVNITQCSRGVVSAAYASGKALGDAGVIAGADMTPEAALMKLAYVLSKDWDLATKRKMMSVNLRGEMAAVVGLTKKLSLFSMTLIEKMAEVMRLSSGEDLANLSSLFPSLLCAAAKDNDLEALEKLRKVGAVFSMVNYDGRTALHVGACEGHLNVVEHLLHYGASVHVRDRYGHSPLDDALRFKRNDIIRLLVATGAHLSLPPAKLGMMLCNSAVHEDTTMLESWWLAGADLSQADYTLRTALHTAAVRGTMDVIEYLVKKGVSVKVKDMSGLTPIDEAKRNKHPEAVRLMETHDS